MKYHKYNALSYGSLDSGDPAYKFFKEFGIFGPMGGELSSTIRKNSGLSTGESKLTCLDSHKKKDSRQQQEEECQLLKAKLEKLERELVEAKTRVESLTKKLNASEATVVKLQRENHKLKVCGSKYFRIMYSNIESCRI